MPSTSWKCHTSLPCAQVSLVYTLSLPPESGGQWAVGWCHGSLAKSSRPSRSPPGQGGFSFQMGSLSGGKNDTGREITGRESNKVDSEAQLSWNFSFKKPKQVETRSVSLPGNSQGGAVAARNGTKVDLLSPKCCLDIGWPEH